jgi:hypothetical protein
VQKFCQRACQIRAANIRRDAKRKANLSTDVKPSGRVEMVGVTTIPPDHSTPLSDSPNPTADRIAELMAKAHSRTGINAFELADLARLRGLSPWTPARLIMSKDYHPR